MGHWFNNGIIEILVESCGDCSFTPGRLPVSHTTKEKMSKTRKGKPNGRSKDYRVSEETKNKISTTLLNGYKNKLYKDRSGNVPWNKGKTGLQKAWNIGMPYEQCHTTTKEEMTTRIIQSKRINKSFNISKQEEVVYSILIDMFTDSDVVRQYMCDTEYPFLCDFYIKSLCLYIECNFHWTHGKEPFDSDNCFCVAKLNEWKEKAKTSQFYQNAITTWTIRDVEKRKIAEKNKLNYEVFYSLSEVQRLSKAELQKKYL